MVKVINTSESSLLTKDFELATQYDKYFEGAEKSIYNRRFGKIKILPRERNLIFNIFLQLVPNLTTNTIKILDFGCGDGRLLTVFEEIAEKLAVKSLNLHLTCFDPSIKAIELFEQSLLDKDYKQISNEIIFFEKSDAGYTKSHFKKNNITIKFIHGNATATTKQLKQFLDNNYNLVILIFGVLSHIVTRCKRQSTLKMLGSLMEENSRIIINVPTAKLFSKEIEKYNFYRKRKVSSKIELAKEERDIYYQRKKRKVNISNYYHIYNFKELNEDISIAQFTLEHNGVSSITHPANLSKKNKIFIYLDSLISTIFSYKIMPYSWKEFTGCYIFSIAKPRKNYTNGKNI